MTLDTAAATRSGRAGAAGLSPGLCLLLGVVAAALGLLPWLVTGLRLPLQNLWATETPPDQMPRVLLPFSQYAIVTIIVVLVVGAAVAGLAARALRSRLPRTGVAAAGVGVLAVQVTALLQTTAAVRDGLAERSASTLYLTALVGVALLAILVGAVALGLVAAAPRGGAVVGLSVGALALGPWLSGLVVPFGTITPSPAAMAVVELTRWVPAVLVGAAIAWGGLRTVGRVAAAVIGLLLLWVVPALTAAIWNSAGSRVLAARPAEMAEYAVAVFVSATTIPALVLPPLLLAGGVAAAGLVVGRILGRSAEEPPRAGQPEAGPS